MQHDINSLYKLYLENPSISTDTRKINKGSIFFSLKGENFNANAFAAQALESGCAYAVVDEKEFCKDSRFILVDNVLKTLQDLAAYHRKQLNIPVLGITGTNGKTTTKELITAVLAKKYNVAATKGNLNNHIGVPLTLLSVNPLHEIAVVEMGANHPGEIGELCKISDPDLGIITNIGKAHLEGFGSLEGIVNTKKELYDSVKLKKGKLFVCRDNGLLMNLSGDIERITYGVFPDSDCRGEICESNPLLKIKWYSSALKSVVDISTNLIGYYNFENVLAAICIGDYFGVDPHDIKVALEDYQPSNHRSQLISTAKNKIIMDSYNANPTSMEAALRNFMQSTGEHKFAILGDMLELGNDSIPEHQRIYELASNAGFEKIVFVGKVFSLLNQSSDIPAFADAVQAGEWVKAQQPENYNILIKGSRGIRLEKLLDYL
jgi:UDP-N-acetylmuramoyl-tripeptide--D-alanyl-D-alanine ligase